ncbi:hypothetical protein F5B17DRAFT_419539 [Nemania serpens]|nr:hypothetical protein F5B17DRAFT_419539 [Nemania serpens]
MIWTSSRLATLILFWQVTVTVAERRLESAAEYTYIWKGRVYDLSVITEIFWFHGAVGYSIPYSSAKVMAATFPSRGAGLTANCIGLG